MSNFKYYEDDFENAVIELLCEHPEFEYECGYDIHRKKYDAILFEDIKRYLNNRYGYFSDDEIKQIISYVTHYSNNSLYRSLKETYKIITSSYNFTKQDGTQVAIDFFDFDNVGNNIFKCVNQFEFSEYKDRRPDVVIFINGIPVSVFELKNPADDSVSIKDAYDQTHIRYSQDIPSLMKFDFINVLSDGANTKYGALFSSYEFYFKWNSNDGNDYENADGIEGIKTLVKGLFEPKTLLTILKNYIYIPDNSDNNVVILPKYYQYYGAEKMYHNILKEYALKSGKGGTYWGATGCGKSYTMLFLSKRLTMSLELDKPTIILLTDRNDLDEQLSSDFENAKTYLVDENSLSIKNRKMLKGKLENVKSGGIYLMTIQKFSEDISLLSDRNNIICISDEAHRTQTNTGEKITITNTEARKSYGFAKYLRDSFPNATYVGFTGTPVDATLRVFGDIIVKYTMKQALDDGATVKITRINGPREVQLDEKIAEICDKYYELQQKEGANEYQIEQSKKDMSKLKVILGNPDRLDVVVKHFIWHYELRCSENATINQKAMFVCYDREIAFEVYKRIKMLRPEWFEKKLFANEYEGSETSSEDIEIEKVKLICTNGKNDPKEMQEVIGTSEDRKRYAKAFKDVKSNFKIAILVDMWITGFDVPSLDTMYLDKPLETHNLIQTISRVNRVFKGKEEGVIVDYIGLEAALKKAMALYNGDIKPVNGAEVCLAIFKDFMSMIDELMNDCDYSKFFDQSISALERLTIIQTGVEYVLADKNRTDNFMGYTLRAKKAFDICIGHPDIKTREVDRLHYYMCISSVIYKMTIHDTPDATLMNKKIQELVDRAISSTYDGKEFNFENSDEDATNIFSDEFLNSIKKIKFSNTRYQALIKLLKKAIKEFGKTNKLKAALFSKKLKAVIDKYNTRNELSEAEEIIEDVVDNLSEELESIFRELKEEKNSFEALGISFDEKAFYDILIEVAEKNKFKDKIEDDKFIYLAKEIKKFVSNKSKYTDWTHRQDIKDELYSDVAVLLRKNGYPPHQPIDDAYDEIMKQVENFKKYED